MASDEKPLYVFLANTLPSPWSRMLLGHIIADPGSLLNNVTSSHLDSFSIDLREVADADQTSTLCGIFRCCPGRNLIEDVHEEYLLCAA